MAIWKFPGKDMTILSQGHSFGVYNLQGCENLVKQTLPQL